MSVGRIPRLVGQVTDGAVLLQSGPQSGVSTTDLEWVDFSFSQVLLEAGHAYCSATSEAIDARGC